MAPTGRSRDIVASRRRRADEGEEDEAGSLDYESQSEVSALSGANDSVAEVASELSETRQSAVKIQNLRVSPRRDQKDVPKAARSNTTNSHTGPKAPMFTSTADMQAMVNGLNPPSDANGAGTLQFEDPHTNTNSSRNQGPQAAGIENRTQNKGSRLPPKITTTAAPDGPRSARKRGRESSGFAYSVK